MLLSEEKVYTTESGIICKEKTATWKPWDYKDSIKKAEKVAEYKAKLKDPSSKDRSKVTAFIVKQSSRQEYKPPLQKYVDKIKAEPLHGCNRNAVHTRRFVKICHISH